MGFVVQIQVSAFFIDESHSAASYSRYGRRRGPTSGHVLYQCELPLQKECLCLFFERFLNLSVLSGLPLRIILTPKGHILGW